MFGPIRTRRYFANGLEIENAGTSPISLNAPEPFSLGLARDTGEFTNYWMVGGNNAPDEGKLQSAPVTATYRHVILKDR